MVSIVVVLATVSASMFLGLTEETDPQPTVMLEGVDTDDPTHKLVHRGGETLDGDRLELQGALEPDAPDGTTLEADDEVTFYPTSEEITVVWYGDNDESYRLTTLTVDQPLPKPDEGCGWVESETNGGTDQIKIDGTVVNCDVKTDKIIEIYNGGTVIGDVNSDLKELDGDDAEVYGSVTAENVLNLQTGMITGSATSKTADIKIDNADVGGSIKGKKVAEITGGTTVEGDMESISKDSKILGGSVVEGSVTADGTVKVQDSTVEGHVYSNNLDCDDSTINGQDCASYTPKDPANW